MTPQEAIAEWKQFMLDIGYDEQPDGSWIHSDHGDVLSSEEARQERHEFAMNLMSQEEGLYGPAAAFSEHHRGDRIRYRLAGEPGSEYTGTILWVAAPVHGRNGALLHLSYLVERDEGGVGFPDTVFPSDVIGTT